MRVRSGPFLLSLLLTVGLAATIFLTREPTPIATASTVSPASETAPAPPRTQTPTNPLCENGTAVSSPADNPGLVADCSVLLAVKDTLRGTVTLNWDAGRAITAWEGVTVTGTPPRVTKLVLQERALTGRLPAALGELTALRTLWLDHNQLTGPIPAALGSLPALEFLRLDDNRLTGAIPAALGSLAALTYLRLDDNQLTGPIPAALAALIQLQLLRLDDNQLTGTIPPALRSLPWLSYLQLDGNSLTGCLPPALRALPSHDLDALGLPDCAAAYTLTASAGAGGGIDPAPGAHEYAYGAEVTLTANWNDATHTFTGWGGDCGGTASACTLTMDADKTVTAAFAALPADRCATPAAADCIRAVYRGAPEDYAQVADIPADRLLTPGADGRYQVERGQQITVVTAARLPEGYTRFYLERRPTEVAGTPDAVSATQLIKPAATTYTFTVTRDEAAPTLITFDLTSARPRPRPGLGQKPELGDAVVTTGFLVPTVRYNRQDTAGAATSVGSYAFLETVGDATSAITTFEYGYSGVVELRIHPTDASGTSRAAFYDTVQVGDSFDYRTNGLDCAFRFRVTSAAATATSRTFGIEHVRGYGGRCSAIVDDVSAARDVHFVWKVPTGIPGPGGARELLQGEPAGPGTYRIFPTIPWVIDVPPGMQVIQEDFSILEPAEDAPAGAPRATLTLLDAATGSRLSINVETGTETQRITTSAEVDALFDQIMASIRRG